MLLSFSVFTVGTAAAAAPVTLDSVVVVRELVGSAARDRCDRVLPAGHGHARLRGGAEVEGTIRI